MNNGVEVHEEWSEVGKVAAVSAINCTHIQRDQPIEIFLSQDAE